MNTDSTIVYRHEYKYVLDCATAIRLYQELSAYLEPDAFSESGAYRVKSLYFDSIENQDFYAKMDGNQVRKKIRLRIYSEQDSKAKLELKAKEENLQYKSSISVTKEDALSICDGCFSPILNYPSDKATMLYTMMNLGAYRPSVLIEYDRFAFVYPEFDTRITFDHHIRSSEYDFRLFASDNLYQHILQDKVVLEVKFNQHLTGFIQDILSRYHLNQVAVSKYCNSRTLYN